MISKINLRMLLFFNMIALLTVISFGSLSHADDTKQQSAALSEVDSKYVCMITDQEFAKEQIPVEVDGKTYYGCCEMCKSKLNNDPQSRVAIDPVSGNKVDKAVAFIGADSEGKVFYFESEENLTQFDPGSGK